jgi:hypothetical protein
MTTVTATPDAEAPEPTAPIPMTIFTIPLCDIFAEWDRRWRECPTQFQSDVQRLLAGQSVETYGETAAATLLGIARDMAEARGVMPEVYQW